MLKYRKGLSLSTFDCTDINPKKAWPFNISMYSKNFNWLGFKYGIALAVFLDNICSSSGPYLAGYSKGKVFKEGFVLIIPDDEPCKVDASGVGIQTAALLVTLWISYGHPARNKRAGFLFKFPFTITLPVIWIYRTVTNPKNWMCLKSLWEFLLIL